jgi:SAM-dependent methyltransferase
MTQTPEDRREWLQVADSILSGYHRRQYSEPNRSTVMFCDWMEAVGLLKTDAAQSVMDIGAGLGANVNYMAHRYPRSRFLGIELNPQLAAAATEALSAAGAENGAVEQGDLYDLDARHVGAFDGVLSYMLLSWLPDFAEPLARMAALRPRWIAMTSLFYDGPVNTVVRTQDYTLPIGDSPYRESYYNIYAMPLVRECLARLGYGGFVCTPFEIDIDLAQPDDGGMRSFTRRLADGRRLQFGGPVHLSWHFIAATRDGGA